VIEFRPFTANDWMGLAGAESFDDGAAPLVADLKVDGYEALAVIDRGGLTLLLEGAELHLKGANVARAVAMLRPEVSSLALDGLGFTLDGAQGVFTNLVRGALEGNDR